MDGEGHGLDLQLFQRFLQGFLQEPGVQRFEQEIDMLCLVDIGTIFYIAGDKNDLRPGGSREELAGQRDAVVLAQLNVQQRDVRRGLLHGGLQGGDGVKDADLAGAGKHLLDFGAQAGRKESVVIADVNGVHVDRCPFLGM